MTGVPGGASAPAGRSLGSQLLAATYGRAGDEEEEGEASVGV